MLYLSKVRLENVRCFDDVQLTFGGEGGFVGWTVILGDNGTGKSALLRSIAIGLCDQAGAAGLMKESTEGYIRRDETQATISIELVDDEDLSTYSIQTSFERVGDTSYERVIQTTEPKVAEFPWHKLFVSGYGAGRGMAGTGDVTRYSPIDAVYNMFNYVEGLQNPELIIHRLSDRGIDVEDLLAKVSRALKTNGIRRTPRGLVIDGPWGEGMPLRDVADGYRSMFTWIADLFGWALAYDEEATTIGDVRGIVLIDEVEAHLHALWQRTLVPDLRALFPKIQFVATSHSPLVASSVGPDEAERLILLQLRDGNRVEPEYVPFMKGWRMDQVLASPAFKSVIDEDPVVERMMKEASELAGNPDRTGSEERRYRTILDSLRPVLLSEGQTLFERKLEISRYEEIREKIIELDRRLKVDEENDLD